MKVTDKQRLDALEKLIAEGGPLLLWDGKGSFPGSACGLRGLSFRPGNRTLRRAIDQCCDLKDSPGRNRLTRKAS